MTDRPKIPPPLTENQIFLSDLLDTNERLERENRELRADVRAITETLHATLDLTHKLQAENVTLRAFTRRLREQSSAERRAA